MTKNKNPKCDGQWCLFSDGETRRLPMPKEGAAIVCRACFIRLMTDRQWYNDEHLKGDLLTIPAWEDLSVYPEAVQP